MSDHACTVAGLALLSCAVVHSRDAIQWYHANQHSIIVDTSRPYDVQPRGGEKKAEKLLNVTQTVLHVHPRKHLDLT